MSSARRASTTRSAARSVTAMRPVRSRSAASRRVRRPRVRTADGESEVPLQTYEHFADRDPLARVVLERMLAGVSTRRYRRTHEPVGEEVEVRARSTSKSAVSRTFVERTRNALCRADGPALADLRLAVMMLDGIELKGRMMIVALGDHDRGREDPARAVGGSTENATVATALLSDLVERGLDPEQGMLFVLDGRRRSGKPCAPCSARCRCSGVSGTRNATCCSISPNATVHRSRLGCAARGPRPTTSARSSSCADSPTSSSTPTPAPPARCARACKRR